MTQTRIQGKFYPLQHEEFLKLNQLLTQAEFAVHLWLKTKDPFGDKLIEASTKQIADDLNVSRRTIQRALVKLRDFNLIDLIITKFQYRVKSNPPEDTSKPKVKEKLRVATPGSPSDTSVAISTRMSPSVRECRHRYENVAIGTGMSPPQPETQSEQKLKNPKTLKTYSDFKKTLSESEGENFLDFVRQKTENLEKPINDLEAWLASKNAAKRNRWEVYYEIYQQEKISQNRKTMTQGNSQGNYSPSRMERAIAEFKKQRAINQPVDEPTTESVNSEEARQREAEFNRLLDNPPEREVRKSPAQQRRENMAKVRQQREAIERANREAAEERAKREQQLSIEERRAEMLRQLEEFNQRQSSQNPEITEEGKDYE